MGEGFTGQTKARLSDEIRLRLTTGELLFILKICEMTAFVLRLASKSPGSSLNVSILEQTERIDPLFIEFIIHKIPLYIPESKMNYALNGSGNCTGS